MHNALLIVGRALRSARKRKGWSQEELASAAGLHRTYVGAVERGERNLSLLSLCRLAKALRIRPARLLDGLE